MAEKWIQKAIKKPALLKELGVKAGERYPPRSWPLPLKNPASLVNVHVWLKH
jgi:hypothetical protein